VGRRHQASRLGNVCVLALALALSAAACGDGDKTSGGEPTSGNEPVVTLDLKRGSFGRVSLGDTVTEMQRVFGPASPAEEGEPATALSLGNDQDYSPPHVGLGPDLGPSSIAAYRYERVVFMVRGTSIRGIIVNDPEAESGDTGLGIGDKLARARAAYDLECGTANEGTEYEPFPACVGRTGPHVYAWFGNDPITNITLAWVRPDGV
jgi:hypothetical protein